MTLRTPQGSALSHGQGNPSAPEARKLQVTVVVLGDVGRSPRMQYQALSLASELAEVDLVGYAGSLPHGAVQDHAHIALHWLRPRFFRQKRKLRHAGFLAASVLAVLEQSARLLWTLLFVVRQPDFILVQNPPAVPTLAVALAAARLRSAKLVIDWHNLAYTLLALRLGARHPVVRLARWYERGISRYADAHICVSRAMQAELQNSWRLGGVTVLYDRPPEVFGTTPLQARHELFRRLQKEPPLSSVPCRPPVDSEVRPTAKRDFEEHTIQTTLFVSRHQLTGEILRSCSQADDARRPAEAPHTAAAAAVLEPFVRLRSGRPALVVSSTSWTPDEDFSILLDALTECEEMIGVYEASRQAAAFPHVLLLITGAGPLRERYEQQFEATALHKFHLRTLWLSAEDYALLLGSADLGLCLHRSSSGLDLPMKVADMFGSGLPVCAFDYGPTLGEQVRHGENGMRFATSTELAQQLFTLLKGFPDDVPLLNQLRRNLALHPCERWPDGWARDAQDVFVVP